MLDKRAGSGSAKSLSSVGVLHGGVPSFSVSGVSLVEMLVAVALLSLVSIAALQLVRMTKNTMVGAEGTISQQQRSEAIAAYIYKDFALGNLRGLAHQVTRDMSRFREFCQGADNGTG